MCRREYEQEGKWKDFKLRSSVEKDEWNVDRDEEGPIDLSEMLRDPIVMESKLT